MNSMEGSRWVFIIQHTTHTFAPQHTTTTTLNQQATQAAYELDSHPSIPQSRHTPTTHLRRLFPLFPLRRSTDALLSGHPRRSVGGVGRICSVVYPLVGLNIKWWSSPSFLTPIHGDVGGSRGKVPYILNLVWSMMWMVIFSPSAAFLSGPTGREAGWTPRSSMNNDNPFTPKAV